MNNRRYSSIIATLLITTSLTVQMAHAEFFRMPLSMFTIIGDPGVKDPNAGVSPPSDPNSPPKDNPGDNTPNDPIDDTPRFILEPTDTIDLRVGIRSSIDFSEYLKINAVLGNNPEFYYYFQNNHIPNGMSFSGSTLSGIPLNTGTINSTLVATYIGEGGGEARQSYNINIAPPTINIKQLGTGLYHTCAVTYEGGMWCWGEKLTIGSSKDELSPWNTGLTNIKLASNGMGSGHCYAFTNSAAVTCRGGNAENGTRNIPGVIKIEVGNYFACALTEAGAVHCWGQNAFGALGDGTTTNRSSPVVPIASGVKDISVGMYHACAVMLSNEIMCWGKNDNYQTGAENYGTYNSLPTLIAKPKLTISNIASGEVHNCVLYETGNVNCWGDGSLGRLGSNSGATPNLTGPTITNAKSITAGYNHTCVGFDIGSVKCWGYGGDGQLGNSSTTATTPVTNGASGRYVVSGSRHSCALSSFEIRCWGRNSMGQVGSGFITSNYRSPNRVNIDF